MPRPQVEVIGVAENNLRAKRFERVLRNRLDRTGRAHRHKDRRLHGLVRKMKLRPTPASFCFRDHFEGCAHQRFYREALPPTCLRPTEP